MFLVFVVLYVKFISISQDVRWYDIRNQSMDMYFTYLVLKHEAIINYICPFLIYHATLNHDVFSHIRVITYPSLVVSTHRSEYSSIFLGLRRCRCLTCDGLFFFNVDLLCPTCPALLMREERMALLVKKYCLQTNHWR